MLNVGDQRNNAVPLSQVFVAIKLMGRRGMLLDCNSLER